MAQHIEGVRVVPVASGQDLDLLAVRERRAQVADRTVRADGHRLLGEPGPDGPRRVEARCAVGEFELRPVG